MKLVLNSFFIYLLFFSSPVFGDKIFKTYFIKVNGIKIGKLEWNINIVDNNYTNNLKLKSEGLLSAIYRFEGEYFSEGVIENGLLKAKKYSHLWKTSKTLKKMSLVFNNNKIMSLDQEPIEKESLRINIFNLEGVNDPISSFLQIIKNGDSALVVDGRRLYMMNPIYNKDIDQTTISLEGYSNLWTDHKRSKFEKIAFKKNSGDLLPTKIFIYFDGRVFKLEQS